MFRRRKDGLPNDQPEDGWNVFQGEHDGQPLIARVNASAIDYVGHSKLPVRLGIAVPFKNADDRGFPGFSDIDALRAIEDLLIDVIESREIGRIVLVVTTGGMREFVCYVRSAAHGAAAAEALRGSVASHEIQDYTAEDPNWDLYRHFASEGGK